MRSGYALREALLGDKWKFSILAWLSGRPSHMLDVAVR